MTVCSLHCGRRSAAGGGSPCRGRSLLALIVAAGGLWGQPLAGTAPLEATGDFAARMVEGIDRYLMRSLAEAPARRQAQGSRERLREIIGAVDQRIPYRAPSIEVTVAGDTRLAAASGYDVLRVRWPVLEGVDAEGLLLRPHGTPRAWVVAVPDADQTPEMLAGLEAGLPPEAQFARRLAENGCLVLAPVLVDRRDTFSGNPAVRMTNQPHREFVFRMAYEMGRHIIGYEVQKALAAVDWFAAQAPRGPIGVFGYGEGGMVALFVAAIDPRIDATVTSGYFQPREQVWREPIYRSVWSQLAEFGDAELARMVAPRRLIIEASPHPEIAGPPPERDGRRGAAPGRLTTPDPAAVRAEFDRIGGSHATLVSGGVGSAEAIEQFLRALKVTAPLARPGAPPKPPAAAIDPTERQRRQFTQLVEFTQKLVRRAEAERRRFWAKADASSIDKWGDSTAGHRRHLWEEVIGKLPAPSEPMAARTRILYDRPSFTGYEVALPVWPDVFAYGIMLVPKNLKPGERRPVVVCQHGLEGRPQHLVDPPDERTAQIYLRYAARLAERGFITYAPQNPYIGGERFRVLLRKAHPLKLSLFSFIVGQHQRTLDWLASLAFVDPARIGFYGLSYGGKTAMRVPPLVAGYALSICSADFNEWIWKITSVEEPFSYMFTQEYDMLEFNLGNTHNYAEMASLIAPRPFMVERGHRDGVGIDEWVAYEYAKVRRFYTNLGIPDRTAIEFFNGPHAIHGVGTFEFLHRHLGWPEPRPSR